MKKNLFSILILLPALLLCSACSSTRIFAGRDLERSFVYSAGKKMDDKAFEEILREFVVFPSEENTEIEGLLGDMIIDNTLDDLDDNSIHISKSEASYR